MSETFDFILFGGSGDLAMRKLLPALYYRHRDSGDTSGWRLIGLGRHPLSREEYLNLALEHCRRHIAAKDFSEAAWSAFARQLDYLRLDANDLQDYRALADWVGQADSRVRVFYLATEPGLFAAICQGLSAAGVVTPASRVVLEKPLGRDLASARRINEEVGAIFSEPQIFRIDHYLGKETVQNLIALRFGNVLLEPLWNRSWVRDVQITIAEMVGLEGRGDFYDRIGALRDMVQSHLLQLLCIVAMEPPANIEADTMRDESLRLDLMAKVPGEGMNVQPISLDVALSETYQTRQWDAYERLIMDVVHGKLTLFMRRDELDAAWQWLEPILKDWQKSTQAPRPYAAGTWGPTTSSTLIARDGNAWREES